MRFLLLGPGLAALVASTIDGDAYVVRGGLEPAPRPDPVAPQHYEYSEEINGLSKRRKRRLRARRKREKRS